MAINSLPICYGFIAVCCISQDLTRARGKWYVTFPLRKFCHRAEKTQGVSHSKRLPRLTRAEWTFISFAPSKRFCSCTLCLQVNSALLGSQASASDTRRDVACKRLSFFFLSFFFSSNGTQIYYVSRIYNAHNGVAASYDLISHLPPFITIIFHECIVNLRTVAGRRRQVTLQWSVCRKRKGTPTSVPCLCRYHSLCMSVTSFIFLPQ